MGARVSAIIPAYNSAGFVGDAVQSVLAQVRRVDEIIVVNDGSSDNTAEVAASYPGVRVISRVNGGPGAARNTGIAAASGEWIALLDADDTWDPRKTEAQLRSPVDGMVAVIHASHCNNVDFKSLWHRQTRITPSGALVRREALLQVGGFDENRNIIGVEDLDMWLRLGLAGYHFRQAGVGLFRWREAVGSHLSGNDIRMAAAELLLTDKIGGLARLSQLKIDKLKDHIRLEYARNLIGAGDSKSGLDLLRDCRHRVPALWLRMAATPHLSRLARPDILKVLSRIPI